MAFQTGQINVLPLIMLVYIDMSESWEEERRLKKKKKKEEKSDICLKAVKKVPSGGGLGQPRTELRRGNNKNDNNNLLHSKTPSATPTGKKKREKALSALFP